MSDLFDQYSQEEYSSTRLSRQQRRALAAQRKREAARRRKSLLAVLLAVVVIGTGGFFAWSWGVDFFSGLSFSAPTSKEEAKDYEGEGTEPVDVTVNEGDTGAAIAQTLYAADVVASPQAFVAAANVHPDGGSIQPGTYALYKKLPAKTAVEMLLDLENLSGNRIEVIPGAKFSDVVQKIKAVTGFTDEQMEAAMEDTEATGLPKQADGSYEGWIADGDYRFGSDVTPEEVLAEMVKRQRSRLKKLDIETSEWSRIANIASIVQMEGREEDFDMIASVIYNRLDINMKLQMDSTVHYVFGGTSDATTSSDQRKDDNPWNTYKYEGLPKTPIGTPSLAALEAAVSPAASDYLFFVAVNPLTKETKFAVTWTEHEANVREYQQWLKENSDTLNSGSSD